MVAPATVLLLFIRNKYFRIFAGLALIYPFGEWLQYMLIGPGWIRWHLSDFGFSSSVGLLFTITYFTADYLSRRYSPEKFPNQLLVGVSIALTIAIVQETYKFLIHVKPNPTHPVSHGDWIDMIVFIISYGLNYWLISKMRQSWDKT